MSTLSENVAAYLATRRTMGFRVEGLGKLLWSFVGFCEDRGAGTIRTDLAIEWATTPIKVPVTDALIARRMDAVRIFAHYQHALDPATQIPDEMICRRRYRQTEPNVFSDSDIQALLAAADTVSPPFKALTWRPLIGLLAATGMRPGEACRLSVADIDLAGGVIQILETKFGKSRLVFIHPSTGGVLTRYPQARPIYHHTRESIDAHLTVVFAALAVSRWIEHQTGWSIKKFVQTARRYRTVKIRAGNQTLTAADPLPADLRDVLAQISAASGGAH